MSKRLTLALLTLAIACNVFAQRVTLDARLIEAESGLPISPIPWRVSIACDALDTLLSFETDSTCRLHVDLPAGRCIVCPFSYPEICLDLRSDTSFKLHVSAPWFSYDSRYLYRSRRVKDSTLRAEETELLANLNAKDTVWPYKPNYVYLADLYEADLFYPLPRWRTFSNDTVLKHLKYCYRKDPKEYEYLYYSICQLEHRMGLPHDRRVRPPRQPDRSWYQPMPELKEDWQADSMTCYGCRYEMARMHNRFDSKVFGPMDEWSLVYPRPKHRMVRLSMEGGLSTPNTMRIEDGRYYYRQRDYTFERGDKPCLDRSLDFDLTAEELDTIAIYLAAFDTIASGSVLGPGPYIDGATFHLEIADTDGYRDYYFYHPGMVAAMAPLDAYLDSLWGRHVCWVTFRLVDDETGEETSLVRTTLKGKHWFDATSPHWYGKTRMAMPKGRYTLRIWSERGRWCTEYKTVVLHLNVQGDTDLGDIRLHRRK